MAYRVAIRRDDKFESITIYDEQNAYFIFNRMQEVANNPLNKIDEIMLIFEENDEVIKAIAY